MSSGIAYLPFSIVFQVCSSRISSATGGTLHSYLSLSRAFHLSTLRAALLRRHSKRRCLSSRSRSFSSSGSIESSKAFGFGSGSGSSGRSHPRPNPFSTEYTSPPGATVSSKRRSSSKNRSASSLAVRCLNRHRSFVATSTRTASRLTSCAAVTANPPPSVGP